jgi:hypothetical protein
MERAERFNGNRSQIAWRAPFTQACERSQMPHPVVFSEAELDIITDAARPIDPAHRAEFVEAVLTALVPHRVLDGGLMHLDLPRSPAALHQHAAHA